MIPSPQARATVRSLQPSLIREVANSAMGRTDVLPFWFGESDQPTADFIRAAAARALSDGQTFYTENLGRPALRQAIAAYISRLHDLPIGADRIAVTGSGVLSLMLAAQMIIEPGDRVVAVTPLWPNLIEIPKILNAHVTRVPLTVAHGRWSLDLERLLSALTPGTKALLLNSPNNPTGWVIDRADQQVVFDHCRAHGIWIIADDVYERLVHAPAAKVAPSFLTLAGPEDRVIGVNSFSKAWSMTGWRLGWLIMPPQLINDLGKVIEYNNSCVPDFIQAGGLAAVTEGEAVVAQLRAHLRDRQRQLVDALTALPGIEVPNATGAMYAFFRIAGQDDSLALAKRLAAEVGLGLAPGRSFGPESEGWLRWCYAASERKLDEGIARLRRFLL